MTLKIETEVPDGMEEVRSPLSISMGILGGRVNPTPTLTKGGGGGSGDIDERT